LSRGEGLLDRVSAITCMATTGLPNIQQKMAERSSVKYLQHGLAPHASEDRASVAAHVTFCGAARLQASSIWKRRSSAVFSTTWHAQVSVSVSACGRGGHRSNEDLDLIVFRR